MTKHSGTGRCRCLWYEGLDVIHGCYELGIDPTEPSHKAQRPSQERYTTMLKHISPGAQRVSLLAQGLSARNYEWQFETCYIWILRTKGYR